ncbi:MAG: hypothetical protein ABIG44_00120, partial [Planctomycetota bacterium]
DDFQSLQLIVRVLLEARQYEQAVEAARNLVNMIKRKHEAEPAQRWLIRTLLVAYDTLQTAQRQYHNTLYRRDARGSYTDQVLPDNEAEAARVLSEMARTNEEQAALNRLLTSHDTLLLVERAVEYQPNNTAYLMDLAGIQLVTSQTQKAIGTYQSILTITSPSDADPEQARRNQESAAEYLRRLNAPLTSQPAGETDSELVPEQQPEE